MPFKPVPPPKPKNYRPMVSSNGNPTNGNMPPNQWDTTVRTSLKFKYQFRHNKYLPIFQDAPRNQNGYYYPPAQSHYHQQQTQPPILPQPPMQPGHGPPIHAYNHGSYPYGSMAK